MAQPLAQKVLIIGLDGGTFDLLRPWADQGYLPNIARLLDEGTSGTLTTTIPPVSASAWVSFATGKNPGQHGVVDFVFPREGSYEVGVSNRNFWSSRAFWNIIADMGRPVGLVNVPMTYPPEQLPAGGYVISSFMAPSEESGWAEPPSITAELREAGGYPLFLPEEHRSGQVDRFIDDMLRFDSQRARAVLRLLQNTDWDCFAFVFESPDTLQHELWHLLDSSHPRHDAAQAARHSEQIAAYYAQLDSHLGELIAAAGDGALVIVLSDHGFGPFHRFFHVNNWLMSQGFLKLKRGPLSLLKWALYRLGFTPVNVFKILNWLHLSGLRKNVKRGRGQGLLKRVFLSFDDVDWPRTQAFAMGNFGQVYINTEGERSQGTVARGEEYDAVRARIIAAAHAYRDPDTGDRVIQRAYRREEVFAGSALYRMPDLLLHTDRSRYVSFGHADFGSNLVIEPSVGQTGHHMMNGILMMAGPAVQRGKEITGARIVDIAPTVLYALGLPIPVDLDGRVLTEVFRPERLEASPPIYGGISTVAEASGEHYSPDDQETVIDRLRAMGYVE
jgi:predicted AlkP superfamily phosphohydrolase/phosphomutase